MSHIDAYRGAARARFKLVLLAYGIRTFCALIIGWSSAQLLAPVNVLALPRMDRELFAPGARVLLQVLAERSGALLPWLRLGWPLVFVTIVVGAVASTVILAALAAPRDTRSSTWLRRAAHAVPANVALTLAGWAVFGGLLFAANLGFTLVPAVVYPIVGEKGADVALALLAFAVAFAGLVTFTVVDLARASNAWAESGIRESLAVALECIGGRFRICLAGATSYGILAIAIPVLVEACLPRPWTLTPGKLMITAVVHQLVVIGLCSLHLWWWAMAIKFVQVPVRQKSA